jgi:hypothetical protein
MRFFQTVNNLKKVFLRIDNPVRYGKIILMETTRPTTVKRHGGLRWMAESDTAGPYYLGNNFQLFASFGTRSLAVERPGSVWQVEAFEVSRAAFEACCLLLDPEENNANVFHGVVRAATKASRAEWRRWSDTITRVGGAEKVSAFHRDVFNRAEKELRRQNG